MPECQVMLESRRDPLGMSLIKTLALFNILKTMMARMMIMRISRRLIESITHTKTRRDAVLRPFLCHFKS